MSDNYISNYMKQDFKRRLESLEESYNKVVEANQKLNEKLDNYNKDEEIQKLKDIMNEGYLIRRRIMKRINEEELKHRDSTGHNSFSIIIGRTHIDDQIKCVCDECGKELFVDWN